jgi:hypothetical protein
MVGMAMQRWNSCWNHLSELGKSLKIYSDEHSVYPPPDKWCDILLQGKYATEDLFKCPGNKKTRCGYAINPNCEPNSPPDTVLLFEAKGGWNAFGGVDLLATDNHGSGGVSLLYNNGRIKFISVDPNGHFNHELNWGEKSKGRGLR